MYIYIYYISIYIYIYFLIYIYIYIYIYCTHLYTDFGDGGKNSHDALGPKPKLLRLRERRLHQNLNSGSLRVNGLTVLQFIAPNISVCFHFWSKTIRINPGFTSCISSILPDCSLRGRPIFSWFFHRQGSLFSFWIDCLRAKPQNCWLMSENHLSISQETKNWWKGSACRFPDHTLEDGQAESTLLSSLFPLPKSRCHANHLPSGETTKKPWLHIDSGLSSLSEVSVPFYIDDLIPKPNISTAFLAGRGAAVLQTSLRTLLQTTPTRLRRLPIAPSPRKNERSSRFAIAP